MTRAPLAERLGRLLHKYRQLAELAGRRDEGAAAGLRGFAGAEARARREAFRSLAREFPGALRELQALPVATLHARALEVEAELREAARDRARTVPVRRFIALALDYHQLFAAALATKLWLARRQPRGCEPSPALASELAAARASGELPASGVISLEGLLRPAGGRLQGAVLSAVAALHGLPTEVVEAELFRPGGEAPAAR